MNLSANTILITGATSGIGLEMALAFLKLNNKVIVCGRNRENLCVIQNRYPELFTIFCDVSVEAGLIDMSEQIKNEFPDLNILINNAGTANNINFLNNKNLKVMEEEVITNYISCVKLNNLLLPLLMKKKEAAIINISSGLAYAAIAGIPLYCASKAALHSYTISLRNQLRGNSVRVIEILPPTVDTKMAAQFKIKKMGVKEFASKVLAALKKDKEEIRIGQTQFLYYMSRFIPGVANSLLNRNNQAT
jgi:uncharacterized oxidoreductase